MAEGKNSFLLYTDIINSVRKLPLDKAGELFMTILRYVNDEDPEPEDLLVQIAFEPIKQQLKRNLKNWQSTKSYRSEAGKKGMEKRWGKKQESITNITKITNDNNVIPAITKITDNVSVSVNDSVSDKERVVDASVVYNAEETVLANPIQFEQICMRVGRSPTDGKASLRKYHLHLEEKEQYPKGRKAIFAGFEKWFANEKHFIPVPVTPKKYEGENKW